MMDEVQEKITKSKMPSVLHKMCEVAPYHIAKYVLWYLSSSEERCSWDELCKCDVNFRKYSGSARKGEKKVITGNVTEEMAKENWLTRDDAQVAMQVYLKHMKNYNFVRIYNKMLDKALNGSVEAAKYLEQLNTSDFLNEKTDEIDDFLSEVHISALKGR